MPPSSISSAVAVSLFAGAVFCLFAACGVGAGCCGGCAACEYLHCAPRAHLPARKLRQSSFSFGFGSCPGLVLLPGLSVLRLRSFGGFEGFDVVAPLVAAEELPFPLPDNAWKNRNCCWLSWTTLCTALLDFINELLRTVDEVTVRGDHVSDSCLQVAREDLVEKVIHGG